MEEKKRGWRGRVRGEGEEGGKREQTGWEKGGGGGGVGGLKKKKRNKIKNSNNKNKNKIKSKI